MAVDYLKIVKVPHRDSINTGLSACKPSTLRNLLGEPRGDYSQECQPVEGPFEDRIETRDVGPFRVTGLDVVLDSLQDIFEKVKAKEPELYELLGSAGMLCCRHVRGSKTSVSNHSWGTAIDIRIGHNLPPYGAPRCPAGFVNLYKYFHEAGWYWGAEFPTTDAMHFEISDELARTMFAQKKKAAAPETGTSEPPAIDTPSRTSVAPSSKPKAPKRSG